MLRTRLTPNLHAFIASSLEEIEYAVEEELSVAQGRHIQSPRLFTGSVTLTCIPPDKRMDIIETQSQAPLYRRRRHISRIVRKSTMSETAVALNLH